MTYLKDFTAALLPRAMLGFALSAKSHFRARAMLRNCLGQIQHHFPEFLIHNAKLIDTGLGNVIVMLDEDWVFRFPRNEWRRDAFSRELWLLGRLGQQTRIKVPDYSYVAPGNYFGGYKKLKGVELSPSIFLSLERSTQEAVIVQLVEFLGIVHGLTSQLGKECARFRRVQVNWSLSSYYFQEQRKYLSFKLNRTLLKKLDYFFELYGQPMLGPTSLIHGDLTSDHLLFDSEKNALGIIDFGETALSDPAQDFAILWSYPEWVMPFGFELYRFRAEDPGLPFRALLHSARFAFDRVWDCLHYNGQTRDFTGTVKTLSRQLALLDV